MSDDLDDRDLTPEDRARLAELEAYFKEWQRGMLEKAPVHLRVLGRVLRRSAATGSLTSFRRFLKKHNVWTHKIERRLAAFRDYLIIRRVDLKDLEPAARERLRALTLRQQDATRQTADYRAAMAKGDDLRCRSCRYFVTAPNDGEGENADKSCVELGTKGADRACFGFTWPPS